VRRHKHEGHGRFTPTHKSRKIHALRIYRQGDCGGRNLTIANISLKAIASKLLVATSHLLVLNGIAAADLPAGEEAFFAEIPTVYSATRLDQSRLEIPASVTVITREMIEASTAVEIPDLLRLVPGFQVAHANGAIFSATYHGSADQIPRRMEVMIDGRSVYLPTVSAVEWSILGIAIEDIERIEVVRGPNTASFGNNAVRGSINIVTRQPFFMRGPYARLTAGANGTANGVLRYGGRLGHADASLTLQYRRDEGFDGVDDHKRIGDARLRATYQAGPRDAFDFQAGFADGEVGGWGEPGDPFNPPRDRTLDSGYLSVAWQRNHPSGERYQARFSITTASHSDLFQAPSQLNPGETFTFGSYDADTSRYDLEFEHRFKAAENFRFVWGANARYDRLTTEVALGENSPASEWSWRLFGNAEWRPTPELIVNAGASTAFREVSADYTSPRIGVNWLFAPNRMIRASASRSHYIGTLYQQYANYYLVDTADSDPIPYVISLGPGLQAEEMTSYEIGYVHGWPGIGTELDVKVYHEALRNEGFSERVRTNPLRLPIVWGDAAGEWTTRGAEVAVRIRSHAGTALDLAYAYSTIEAREPTAADADYNPIAFRDYDDTAPRHTLSAQLSGRLARDLAGTLAVFYVDDMRWRGLGDSMDAYTRVDLKLAKNWRAGRQRLATELIVQNLFDDAYSEFADPNRFDRRAYLQLRVESR
jgi:iron complex outermembrane receptor protein